MEGMMAVKVIDVNVGIYDENNRIADEIREENKKNGTFMINIMASPGAGKTTALLHLSVARASCASKR